MPQWSYNRVTPLQADAREVNDGRDPRDHVAGLEIRVDRVQEVLGDQEVNPHRHREHAHQQIRHRQRNDEVIRFCFQFRRRNEGCNHE